MNLTFIISLSVFQIIVLVAAIPQSVKLYFQNEADVPVMINWVDTLHGNLLVNQKSDGIIPKSGVDLNSFPGHKFVVFPEGVTLTHYFKNDRRNQELDLVYFTKSEWDETVTISRSKEGKLVHNTKSIQTDVRNEINDQIDNCGFKSSDGIITEKKLDCLVENLAKKNIKNAQELSKSRNMLQKVGDSLRKYTCVDTNLNTTGTLLWQSKWEGKETKALLDDKDAKIILIDDYISRDECDALIDSAVSKLHAATVNGPTGNDLVYERRAKNSGVPPKLHLKEGEDIITDLYRRTFRFMNFHTGYDLSLEGQENFTVIKYEKGDEYMPHCDGDCTGSVLKNGGRVATMVMYCRMPEAGGGTSFSSVNTIINAKEGQAAFFSYYDKDENRMDYGKTRHSGCPVLAGTKWIATLWMRKGVTANDKFINFDPDGRRRTVEKINVASSMAEEL